MMCPKKVRTSCNRQLNAGPSTQRRNTNLTQGCQLNVRPSTQHRAVRWTQGRQLNAGPPAEHSAVWPSAPCCRDMSSMLQGRQLQAAGPSTRWKAVSSTQGRRLNTESSPQRRAVVSMQSCHVNAGPSETLSLKCVNLALSTSWGGPSGQLPRQSTAGAMLATVTASRAGKIFPAHVGRDSRVAQHVQGRICWRWCSSRGVPFDHQQAQNVRHCGSKRQLYWWRDAEQARCLDSEVFHRARFLHELGWHGENRAPHLLLRALGCVPEDHPVLLTEAPVNSQGHAEVHDAVHVRDVQRARHVRGDPGWSVSVCFETYNGLREGLMQRCVAQSFIYEASRSRRLSLWNSTESSWEACWPTTSRTFSSSSTAARKPK